MNRYEKRRLRLIEIRDLSCKGSIAVLAQRLGKSESYVGRMLWPEGRDGRKRIGENMAEHVEQSLGLPRGFLDSDLDVAEYLASATNETVNTEKRNNLLHKSVMSSAPPKGSVRVATQRIPQMPYPVSPESYYLPIEGLSMSNPGGEPSLGPGDLVLVDPKEVVESMCLVAVRLPGATDPVVRQLVLEGGQQYLRAVNPQWPAPVQVVPEGAILLGRVISKLVRY